MSVLKELYAFRELVTNSEDKIMSTGEFALWCALKMYQKEISESFRVPTFMLEKLTGLSRQGLYNAREKLIKKGFIEYLTDTAVNKPGLYKVYKIDTGVDTRIDTEVDSELSRQGLHNTREEPTGKGVAEYPPDTEMNKPDLHKAHIIDTGVYTEVDTEIDTEVPTEVPAGVHSEVDTKVYTEIDTKVDAGVDTKVHTKEKTTDFNKLFHVDEPVLKTNTFSKAGKVFKRMISDEP